MVANILSVCCSESIESKQTMLEMLENPISIEDAMAELERQVPKAYQIWRQLFENGKKLYIENPSSNLMVGESKWADHFDAFSKLNWKTKVGFWISDVGYKRIPSYLKDYPVDYIYRNGPTYASNRASVSVCTRNCRIYSF